jgi:hypothetical protein
VKALLGSLVAVAGVWAQGDTAWQSLFNGKDLSNWGYIAAHWKVDSGMIVGKSKTTFNHFCHTTKPYSDFVLTLKGRLWETSSEYINSGIQYRSVFIDSATHRLKGYQFDIGDGYDGSMYPEGGYPADARGVGRSEDCRQAIKANGWNQYTITANGNKIKHEVNGKVCNEYTGSVTQGYIGLQLHFTSVPMEVNFKDVFIRPLNNAFVIPPAEKVYLGATQSVVGIHTKPQSHRPTGNQRNLRLHLDKKGGWLLDPNGPTFDLQGRAEFRPLLRGGVHAIEVTRDDHDS